jgi:tRNA A37 methylthiotransferase MiaB
MDCPEDIPPGCGFCSVPNTWGPPRSRYAESITDEVAQLIDLGVHRIVLEAPDFLDYARGARITNACSPPANIDVIGSLLNDLNAISEISKGEVHLTIENMKACLFTEEVAATLSKALPSISPNIGLETGSDEHMTQIGKCGNRDDVLRAVRVARKYQMTPFVYFIYGLPGESLESIQSSIQLMREVSQAGAERIILYGFRSLPGSAFADFPDSRSDDPLSEPLRNEAVRINRMKKDHYVGRTVRGVAAEPSWSRHGYTMVYPLGEGPVMTVRGGFSEGTLLELHITKVLSAGLLEAEVLRPEDKKIRTTRKAS